MFTADAFINTVQNGKKTFVKTFVTNETAQDAMIRFIDAQGEYTKQAAQVGKDTATSLASEVVKQWQDVSKSFNKFEFDYTKFGEGIMKAYTATAKK